MWITTREAAEISGYNLQHIRRIAREGLIKCQKWGQEWMIDRDSLADYIKHKGRRPKATENT